MKIVAISNPISGNNDKNQIKEELDQRFSEHYFEFWETQQSNHATDMAKKAIEMGFDIIIAVGGDGTVIEIIAGMINSNVKLGIIPYGTGNMLAANLGIPTLTSKSIDTILEGHSQKIDIGKINNKYFAFMAGCGFDSRLIKELPKENKKKFGLWAYFIEGFKQAFKAKSVRFKIKLDNEKTIRTKALTVIVANSANILGNLISLAPHASLSDGILDIIVISVKDTIDYIPALWEIITRQSPSKFGKIKYYKAKEIEIETKPNLLVQADGDIIGKTPIKISIIPKSINVLIPSIQENNDILKLTDERLRDTINKTLDKIKLFNFNF